MGFKTKSDFQFTATGGELDIEKMEDGTEKVNQAILKTSDVSTGKVTHKPRYEDEETYMEDGIKKKETKEKKYTYEELPENVKNALRQANQQEEIEIRADIVKYTAESEKETDSYFIRRLNSETLQAILLQDDSK